MITCAEWAMLSACTGLTYLQMDHTDAHDIEKGTEKEWTVVSHTD